MAAGIADTQAHNASTQGGVDGVNQVRCQMVDLQLDMHACDTCCAQGASAASSGMAHTESSGSWSHSPCSSSSSSS
eukprot:CAMPEP_0202881992 /NCGR_PEP_ID=MMETSP1391-20130828/37364_1 /ASSEMBLY_ACC=CAM_ASM_000867 /TAXON_ID=1034604 /ORGANISM="Chlamydomonas leiostraca, Strain SAG 11-49" /LENGTH=75 /DNA_ID=CAMNT_0049564771 /DNA_START=671 /DNA_END=896 /DNA_ORIENTATION=-